MTDTAATEPLNRALLAGNVCFGCGLENPAGLRIEIGRDPAAEGTLRARFTPSAHMAGFPGITHGGAIYAALDCLSTWVATLTGPNRGAAWLLRSARTTYHKPAPVGEPIVLTGTIVQRGSLWEPVVVHTEAVRADGALCVDGEFKVVPVARDRLATLAGVETLPDNWIAFLSGGS